MLYARVDKEHWPMEWEKCELMFNHLQRIVWGYQMTLARKMFATEGADYECSIIRWENGVSAAVKQNKERTVLVISSDPKQIETTLFMLINEAEVQAKAAGNRVSMVP